MTARVVATCFAVVAFATSLLVGLAANLSTDVILLRSLLAMLAAWLIGRLLGAITQHVVQAEVDRYRQEHPIPEVDFGGGAESADGADDAGGEAVSEQSTRRDGFGVAQGASR